MPLQSKAQLQRFQQMVKEGKMKQSVLDKWITDTPNMANLPDKKQGPIMGIQDLPNVKPVKVIK